MKRVQLWIARLQARWLLRRLVGKSLREQEAILRAAIPEVTEAGLSEVLSAVERLRQLT